MTETGKNKKIELFLDLAILVLVFAILLLGSLVAQKEGLLPFVNDSQLESSSNYKDYFNQRKFPEDFTNDEKLALVPQTDDVPRQLHLDWDRVIQEIAEDVEALELVPSGNDCFGRPTVLHVSLGQKVRVVNKSETDLSIAFGEQSWDVPFGREVEISPVFEILSDFKDYFSYGYGCGANDSPSGLFFVDEF